MRKIVHNAHARAHRDVPPAADLPRFEGLDALHVDLERRTDRAWPRDQLESWARVGIITRNHDGSVSHSRALDFMLRYLEPYRKTLKANVEHGDEYVLRDSKRTTRGVPWTRVVSIMRDGGLQLPADHQMQRNLFAKCGYSIAVGKRKGRPECDVVHREVDLEA